MKEKILRLRTGVLGTACFVYLSASVLFVLGGSTYLAWNAKGLALFFVPFALLSVLFEVAIRFQLKRQVAREARQWPELEETQWPMWDDQPRVEAVRRAAPVFHSPEKKQRAELRP